jgi:hypothetical protein
VLPTVSWGVGVRIWQVTPRGQGPTDGATAAGSPKPNPVFQGAYSRKRGRVVSPMSASPRDVGDVASTFLAVAAELLPGRFRVPGWDAAQQGQLARLTRRPPAEQQAQLASEVVRHVCPA